MRTEELQDTRFESIDHARAVLIGTSVDDIRCPDRFGPQGITVEDFLSPGVRRRATIVDVLSLRSDRTVMSLRVSSDEGIFVSRFDSFEDVLHERLDN